MKNQLSTFYTSSLDISNSAEFNIHAGKDLVFNGTEDMPQAVIDLWGGVWNYFTRL